LPENGNQSTTRSTYAPSRDTTVDKKQGIDGQGTALTSFAARAPPLQPPPEPTKRPPRQQRRAGRMGHQATAAEPADALDVAGGLRRLSGWGRGRQGGRGGKA
jgi:hypothetical protein